MNPTHTTASGVRIGDNVWEHTVVKSIVDDKTKLGEHIIVFNAGEITEWVMRPDEHVLITNR